MPSQGTPDFERLIASVSQALRVDFIFSTTPYEAQAIDRAVEVEILIESVRFPAAEDLILHKIFAGRGGDARQRPLESRSNRGWSRMSRQIQSPRSRR